jgi:hypothetical protein
VLAVATGSLNLSEREEDMPPGPYCHDFRGYNRPNMGILFLPTETELDEAARRGARRAFAK